MSKQSLDPDIVLSCLKYGDLYYLLNDNASNYTNEKLIYNNYIRGVFRSFYEVSNSWSNLVDQIRSYVTEFDNVEPPEINTTLSELEFLGFDAFVNTNGGDLRVRDAGSTNSNVLDTIGYHTRLNVLEKGDSFWKVQYNVYDETGNLVTKEGYVSAQYIKEKSDL